MTQGTNYLVFENCVLLGCYTVCSGNSLPTPLKMGPIGCRETWVRNYRYTLYNSPKDRSFRLFRGGSLKSRVICRALNIQQVLRYYQMEAKQ